MHSNKASLVLAFMIVGIAAWAVISAARWPIKAALFPLVIGIPLLVLAVAEIVWIFFGSPAAPGDVITQPVPQTPGESALRRTCTAIAWILGLFAVVVLLGFPLAVALFVFVYVKWQGRESWLVALLYTLAVCAVFYGVFDQLLHLPFPDGWVQTTLGLK